MSYKTTDFRGTAQDGITFKNEAGGDQLFYKVKDIMKQELRERGIAANVREDALKSGGIFGSSVPMLVISHPTSRYFDIGVYVNGPTVCFPLLGESAENTKYNKKKFYEDNGNYLRAALTNPDELELQREAQWQMTVLECFNDNIN